MSRSVTLDGDVNASPGSTMYADATAGAWAAGPVIHELGAKIKVGGTFVCTKATCTFTFTGTKDLGFTPVVGTSTVSLEPGATLLKDGGTDLLLDGDENSDSYGNALKAEPEQTKLKVN